MNILKYLFEYADGVIPPHNTTKVEMIETKIKQMFLNFMEEFYESDGKTLKFNKNETI